MRLSLQFCSLLCTLPALSAQTLTTGFASNAGFTSTAPAPGAAFDIDVLNPAGVVITGFDINTSFVGNPGRFEMYTTDSPGTAFGFQINPPAGVWSLRTTGSYVTAGNNTPAAVTLDKPVYLPAGARGVYLVYRGTNMRYTDTTVVNYGNADMTLTFGTAQSTAFTSALNSPRVLNLNLHYRAPGDEVDFVADVVSGAGPLTVNFRDQSTFQLSTPGVWDWDFDGDGITDSNLQNPTATYPACGTYSPRLRVFTTTGFVERTWTNMITVDPLRADFTYTPVLGSPLLTVNFTDASSGATAWAWDFDGDGVTDSTLQNPTHTFGAGSYGVRLTVSNACRSTSVIKRVDAVTNTWATAYNAATNLVAKQALAFLDVVMPAGDAIIITAIDVNTIVHVTQPCPIKVWMTEGTASGKQQQASAWREVANGFGISAGGNVPTRIVLDRPILLIPGRTHGMAINYLDAQAYYNSPGAPNSFSPDFQINFWGVNTATTPFSTVPTTRQWNGGFYYTKVSSWPIGAITPFAQGCAGALGVPSLKPIGSSRPKLGTPWSVEVGNLPVGAAFMILGFSNSASIFGQLPLNLAPFGMPGCSAFVSSDVTSFLFSGAPTANFGTTFPAAPALAGLQLYMQSLALDPTANAFGGVMSDALALVTGIY
jgi:PKD repeat protein